MNRHRRAIFTIVIVFTLIFPVNTFLKFSEMINVINYLKSYAQITIKDVLLLSNGICFTELVEDIHNYISSMEPNFRFISYDISNGNTTKLHHRISLANIPTLIFLCNFDLSINAQALFNGLPIRYLEDNIWLFQFSRNYNNSVDAHDDAQGLILADSYQHSRFSLSSHIYIVLTVKEQIQLFESYRVCHDRTPTIKWISHIPTQDSISNQVWDNRKNLEQCEFRVGYMDYGAMLINVTNNGINEKGFKDQFQKFERLTIHADGLTMYGYRAQLFKLLQYRLNFSIKWVHVKDLQFGAFDYETDSWSGIIGMILNDVIDTSILDLSWTADRDRYISYTKPIERYTAYLYFEKPRNATLSWTTFINVFDMFYWYAILTSILAFTAFCYIILFLSRRHKYPKSSMGNELLYVLEGISLSFRVFAGFDVVDNKNPNERYFLSKRLLIFVMCSCGILNLYVYNAGLISYLMIQNYKMPISDLGDILEKPEYKLLVLNGTSDATFLKYSYDRRYRLIWNKTMDEGGLVTSHEEAFEKLLKDPRNVYFGISPEVELSTDTYPCQLMRSKIAHNWRYSAYAFKNNSPYIKVFSHQIQKLVESGLETEIESSLKKDVQCNDASEQSFRTLSYNDIILGFAIFVVGSSLAIVNLVFEYLFQICHSKNIR